MAFWLYSTRQRNETVWCVIHAWTTRGSRVLHAWITHYTRLLYSWLHAWITHEPTREDYCSTRLHAIALIPKFITFRSAYGPTRFHPTVSLGHAWRYYLVNHAICTRVSSGFSRVCHACRSHATGLISLSCTVRCMGCLKTGRQTGYYKLLGEVEGDTDYI